VVRLFPHNSNNTPAGHVAFAPVYVAPLHVIETFALTNDGCESHNLGLLRLKNSHFEVFNI